VAKAKIARLDDNDGGRALNELKEGPGIIGEEQKEEATTGISELGATKGTPEKQAEGTKVRYINGFRIIGG
jgi:hypothetical protein